MCIYLFSNYLLSTAIFQALFEPLEIAWWRKQKNSWPSEANILVKKQAINKQTDDVIPDGDKYYKGK